MTSPWQHIPSMRIYTTKWRIRYTHSIMRRTHPLLRSYRDTAKLACHCTARYQIEWIYTQSKMSGGGSLELALERMRNGLFFEHLVLTFTNILMNDLGLVRCTICWRFWFSHLEISQNYLFWDSWVFIMYYIYGISGPSLLIESTDSMIHYKHPNISKQVTLWDF